MGSKLFLFINAIAIIFIISRIIAGRKAARPTPLAIDHSNPPQKQVEDPPPEAQAVARERSLNCTFVFNGHTFDAFEVLGIPSGSSRDACLRAVLDLRGRSSHQDDFFNALMKALERL